MGAARPLEGLLVVSLEQAVAAPLCSLRLAEAGAETAFPERGLRAGSRDWVRIAISMVLVNRGKRASTDVNARNWGIGQGGRVRVRTRGRR